MAMQHELPPLLVHYSKRTDLTNSDDYDYYYKNQSRVIICQRCHKSDKMSYG